MSKVPEAKPVTAALNIGGKVLEPQEGATPADAIKLAELEVHRELMTDELAKLADYVVSLTRRVDHLEEEARKAASSPVAPATPATG